jgi:hypothetical protein
MADSPNPVKPALHPDTGVSSRMVGNINGLPAGFPMPSPVWLNAKRLFGGGARSCPASS